MAVFRTIRDWWLAWWTPRDEEADIRIEHDAERTSLIIVTGNRQQVISMTHDTAAAVASRLSLTQSCSDNQQSIAALRHIVTVALAEIDRVEGGNAPTTVFHALDHRGNQSGS